MFITPFHVPGIPASLPVYRTLPPRWTSEGIAHLAARLGVDAPVEVAGPWLLCRDERVSVEIYQASHSVRVTRTAFDLEGTAADAPPVAEHAAVERATQFLDTLHDIHMSRPLPPTLSRIETVTRSSDGSQAIRTVATQVNYRFTLHDLLLRGPGAKAQVTIGPAGGIDQAYLFWRQVEQTDAEWPTRPADASLDALTKSPHFAAVAHTGDVEVSKVQVDWLCLPPTTVQQTLFPVYEIRGRVIAGADATRDFIAYAAAADTPSQSRGLRDLPALDRWPPHVIA